MWQARQENAAQLASIERHVQRNTAGVSSDAAERSAPACDATYDFAPSYDVYRNDGFKVTDPIAIDPPIQRFIKSACLPACLLCVPACLPACVLPVNTAGFLRRCPFAVHRHWLLPSHRIDLGIIIIHRAAAAAAAATVPAKFSCSTGVRPLSQVLCAMVAGALRGAERTPVRYPEAACAQARRPAHRRHPREDGAVGRGWRGPSARGPRTGTRAH